MNHEGTEAQRNRLNELSRRVIGFCIEVHREFGPGLPESSYEEALGYELSQSGLNYERQREIPLIYKDIALNCSYRLDLIVEDELIVELKSVTEILPVHQAQLLTYLKICRKPLGLLINFNAAVLKEDIHRIVFGPVFQNERFVHKEIHSAPLCLSGKSNP